METMQFAFTFRIGKLRLDYHRVTLRFVVSCGLELPNKHVKSWVYPTIRYAPEIHCFLIILPMNNGHFKRILAEAHPYGFCLKIWWQSPKQSGLSYSISMAWTNHAGFNPPYLDTPTVNSASCGAFEVLNSWGLGRSMRDRLEILAMTGDTFAHWESASKSRSVWYYTYWDPDIWYLWDMSITCIYLYIYIYI